MAICHTVFTLRLFIWLLMTWIAAFLMVAAMSSPVWLLGTERATIRRIHYSNSTNYRPSLGVYVRCSRIHENHDKYHHCGSIARHFTASNDIYPDWWKASLILFTLGLGFHLGTVILSVLTICIRRTCGKSIFIFLGVNQAIAGILYSAGLLTYPAGWDSPRVREVCGLKSRKFYEGDCSFGWPFYVSIVGIFCIFLCSMLTIEVRHSLRTRRVLQGVDEGKACIFGL